MAVVIPSRARSLRSGFRAVRSLPVWCALLLAPALLAQAPATPPKDSPAQKFPYPGDPAPATAPANQPDAPKPSSPSADDPAKKFPYPGEKNVPQDSGSTGPSSSSSSSSSAADPDMPAATDPSDPDYVPEKSVRHKLPKVRVLQSDEDREAEDVKIAKYYGSTGNWNAAYLRSKDAVKIKPDDPDARLLLGESAHKLNKKDEAVEAYSALLKLDASDDQVKAAHKALSRLQ
jgi:tetratricopeptide (TPR) repeat protein